MRAATNCIWFKFKFAFLFLVVTSWGWNQSISRKKMTAFLYEGLVKTHLTRVSRKQTKDIRNVLEGQWQPWFNAVSCAVLQSTWDPTCRPKPSPPQKLLQRRPRPIFLDHRQGSYSTSPLGTTEGGLNVLQECVSRVSVWTDRILWATFLWGGDLGWLGWCFRMLEPKEKIKPWALLGTTLTSPALCRIFLSLLLPCKSS